jgi:plasmid stabilization system protein ParE
VAETRRWYDQRQAGVGQAFTADLAKAIHSISERPSQFTRVHGDVRRAVLARFPYAVYFRPAETEVIVLAVHGRQDPARWQRRK